MMCNKYLEGLEEIQSIRCDFQSIFLYAGPFCLLIFLRYVWMIQTANSEQYILSEWASLWIGVPALFN